MATINISRDVCDLCTETNPEDRGIKVDTVTFVIGGDTYPLDVCRKHLTEIRHANRDYLAHATKVPAGSNGTGKVGALTPPASSTEPATERSTPARRTSARKTNARKRTTKRASKRTAKKAAKPAARKATVATKAAAEKKVAAKPANGKASTSRATLVAGNGDAADKRQWAIDNGYEVGDRGKLPTAVEDAYAKAHSGSQDTAKVPAVA